MRQEIQWYLAERLANARARREGERTSERTEATMAAFSGALGAFRYLGEISEEEQLDWDKRARAAVGLSPAPTLGGRVTTGVVPPSGVARGPVAAGPVRRFVRSVLGPDTEFDLHGGKLRVLAADIYDTTIDIRWRVGPEPDVAAVFPSEVAQLVHDAEGTDDWAAEELQRKGKQRLQMMRLFEFELSDDLGTEYMSSGASGGGGGGERSGNASFAPAPPQDASVVTLTWHGVEVAIPL